jgi:glutamate/tyrosine decarboxylase-like PLP-dependent enzyme
MVSDLLAGWRAERSSVPILPSRAVWKKGLRTFHGALPRRGQTLPAIRRDVEQVLRLSRRNDSPRFWGYVNPPGTEIGALADWLAGGINQNVSCWRSAPGATLVELQVIGWIRAMVGLPRGASGLLTSGGSMANLAGLAAAREAAVAGDLYRRGLKRARGGPLALYASDEVHHSIDKAAALLGIGSDQVRLVPTDRRQRLDVEALLGMLRKDRRAGLKPFCVVANGGTVVSGAVDPLPRIATLCRRERLWLHVDACYGGFAAMAPSGRRLLKGLGRADSIALDPHKWLYAPHDAGCILYRNGAAARRAYRLGADYIKTFGGSPLEQFAFWDYGPELSRRFRALKIWLAFKYHGGETLASAIENDFRLAKVLAEKVRLAPDLELLSSGDLSIVCFRFIPAGRRRSDRDLNRLNQSILLSLQEEGRVFLTNARLGKRFALRACLLNYRTTPDDLDELIRQVIKVGTRLSRRRSE